MKRFKGKALYQPEGKAAEYSEWAVNFYTGCSNDCEYCYCKRGVMSHVWSTTPKLKKCFRDADHACRTLFKEVNANLEDVRKHGLLFSFTTDPLLPNTKLLTLASVHSLVRCLNVPVKVLTKRADWLTDTYFLRNIVNDGKQGMVAFGFTLTGFDAKEPNASSNRERIEAMKKLHEMGFKTWASIEPVISVDKSLEIIKATIGFCDLYKVGLLSGVKGPYYSEDDISWLLSELRELSYKTKIYVKDSVFDWFEIEREDFDKDMDTNFIGADYNIFTN